MYKTGVSGSFLGRSAWAVLQTSIFQYVRPLPFRSSPWWCTKANRRPSGRLFCFIRKLWGLEPERQHLSRRFAQREARNVRRHMSQELRSVATNDAIRISNARGQPWSATHWSAALLAEGLPATHVNVRGVRPLKATEWGAADRRAVQQIAKPLMVYQVKAFRKSSIDLLWPVLTCLTLQLFFFTGSIFERKTIQPAKFIPLVANPNTSSPVISLRQVQRSN